MEISKYIISTEVDESIILYSTLTTALISIDKNSYNSIFIKKDFSNEGLCSSLLKMGFIENSEGEQLKLIEELREKDILSPVQTIVVYTTNRCNARCYYCFERGIKQVDMTRATADKLLDFISLRFPQKDLSISWFGGEPLYNFDIIVYITQKLIELGYNLYAHITTNGSLIDEDKISFFKKYYRELSIQVTIDDVGEKYNKIKSYIDIKDRSPFDMVISNCKLILQNDIKLSIRINYNTYEIDRTINIYKQLKSYFENDNKNNLRLYLAAITMTEDYINLHTESKEEHADNLFKALAFASEQGLYNPRATDERQRLLSAYCLLPKPSSCAACRKNYLTVDAEGYIYKCHRLQKYERYRIGSVYNGLKKTNYVDKFEDYHVYQEKCKECNILPICQQGCFAVKELYDQDLDCETKEVQEELLLKYFKDLKRLSKCDL